MTFQEAEKAYKDLRAQFSAGKLSSADFETEVSKLKLQDDDGRWWQIGVQSGEWYVHDGEKWNKAKPPIDLAPTPEEEPPALPETPAVKRAAPTSSPPPSSTRPAGKLPARLFSPAPARGQSGLPVPLVVGVIVVAALIGAGILFAAYSFLSGQLSSSGTPVAKATFGPMADVTSTSTSGSLVRTSAVPPTLPPIATETSLALPTLATATVPSMPLTSTLATATPKPPSQPPAPTATRKPAPPPPTATPAAPPGVYVTKMVIDPPAPSFGSSIQFQTSFLNTTGNVGPGTWLVKIFKCAAACTGDELRVNKSIGETPKSKQAIMPGATDQILGSWVAGQGSCTYVASPYYYDAMQNPVPFMKPDNTQLYTVINVCH